MSWDGDTDSWYGSWQVRWNAAASVPDGPSTAGLFACGLAGLAARAADLDGGPTAHPTAGQGYGLTKTGAARPPGAGETESRAVVRARAHMG